VVACGAVTAAPVLVAPVVDPAVFDVPEVPEVVEPDVSDPLAVPLPDVVVVVVAVFV
jgi:hypothetical protein